MSLVFVNGQKTHSIVEQVEFRNLKITFHEDEEGNHRIIIWPKGRHRLCVAVVENTLTIASHPNK